MTDQEAALRERDMFGTIERVCNRRRRHPTLGCLSPTEIERKAASDRGAGPSNRQQLSQPPLPHGRTSDASLG